MVLGNITGICSEEWLNKQGLPVKNCDNLRGCFVEHYELTSDGNLFFTDSSNIRATGQQMKAVGARFKNK